MNELKFVSLLVHTHTHTHTLSLLSLTYNTLGSSSNIRCVPGEGGREEEKETRRMREERRG
jgi:hypothetical protein